MGIATVRMYRAGSGLTTSVDLVRCELYLFIIIVYLNGTFLGEADINLPLPEEKGN